MGSSNKPAPPPVVKEKTTTARATPQVEAPLAEGQESTADLAAREKITEASPVKAKRRGRRSLITADLGSGVAVGRGSLG